MAPDELLLQRLSAVLPGAVEVDDLVVSRRLYRNRSDVVFVALRGEPLPRWVVKTPSVERAQLDVHAPLPSVEQMRGAQRLHAFLEESGAAEAGIARTPIPVAMLSPPDAWVMEYVPGRTLLDLGCSGRGVARPCWVEALDRTGQALRAIHDIEPAVPTEVNLGRLEALAWDKAARHVVLGGLPARAVRRHRHHGAARHETAASVLLHGDFCPENLLLAHDGSLHVLDAQLDSHGLAEVDVARFLVMLVDDPLTVTLGPTWSRSARRQATAAFLRGYYRDAPVPRRLRPLLHAELAARWHARVQDVDQRGNSWSGARRALLHRHFGALLREVADPEWTGTGRADPAGS